MRKLLLGLISILLLGLAIYTAIYGISIGSLEINGIPAIQEENTKLENKIKTASQLKNTEYPQNHALLEGAYKKLVAEKESYEQIVALGVDENGLPLNKIQEYEMERIWVVVGNYAKKQGVDLKIDVTSNNSISKTYDLNFSVTGGYIQITDFLYDIERDNTLAFKLENFKMIPGTSTDALLATFTCKDIKLNITENNNTQAPVTPSNDNNNANGENTSSETNKEKTTSDTTNTTNNTTNTTNT